MNRKQAKLFFACIVFIFAIAFLLTGFTSQRENLRFTYLEHEYSYTSYDSNTGVTVFSDSSGKEISVTEKDSSYTVTVDGRDYISTVTGDGKNYTINVQTPENAHMYYEQRDLAGMGGGDLKDTEQDRTIMKDVIEQVLPAMAFVGIDEGGHWKGEIFIMALVALGLGIVNCANPTLAFSLSEGWKYKNVEPSEGYLLLTRLGGILLIIVGVVLIFMSFA